MSDTTPAADAPEVGNPLPHQGDHDRIQMLSLRADGTPDQHNPEMIGDKEAALAATKEQFAQQAVAAVDAERAAGPVTLVGQKDGSVKEVPATTGKDDAATAQRKSEHEAAQAAAEAAAEATVNALHQEG